MAGMDWEELMRASIKKRRHGFMEREGLRAGYD